MAYLVSLAARAERDCALLFDEKHVDNSPAAEAWYVALRKAILSLERMPTRCPVAPENPELRNLLFGRKPHVYRIIFQIDDIERRVDVLHVRHGARRPAKLRLQK